MRSSSAEVVGLPQPPGQPAISVFAGRKLDVGMPTILGLVSQESKRPWGPLDPWSCGPAQFPQVRCDQGKRHPSPQITETWPPLPFSGERFLLRSGAQSNREAEPNRLLRAGSPFRE